MDTTELRRRLLDLREGRGLSIRDLEETSGVHRNTISGIETGKHGKPRPSTLRRLAEALDVEVEDLTGGPLGEAALFSDEPYAGPDGRGVAYLEGFTDLVTGADKRLAADIGSDAVDLDAVERVAALHRDLLEFAAPKIGLKRDRAGLPEEEARALDRLGTALDDLRSTIDDGYDAAIRALTSQRAEVKGLDVSRPIREGGTQTEEARSA